MLQTPPKLPDLSVDFMSWLNAELRRRLEGGTRRRWKSGRKAGLVNRLKAYLSR